MGHSARAVSLVVFALAVTPGLSNLLTWCDQNGSCYPGLQQETANILTQCFGNVTVTASSTCGVDETGPFSEKYCEGNPLQIGQPDICDLICRSDNETLHHPPEFAIDGDNSTAWQSSQAEENVTFTVHLPRRIVLTEASMMFRSLLPKQFTLEARAWSLGETTWLPLKRWALRCNWPIELGGYDMPAQLESELSGNLDPACNSDDFKTAKIDGSQVSFRPLHRVNESVLFSDENLTEHLVVDQIRLQLSLLQTKYGSVSPPAPQYYFGLYELGIGGRCHCNGHSNSCQAINTDAMCRVACDCLHNTMGEYCEMCLPLYNNKDWQPGFGEDSNACEECECHGHAQSCHYDRTLQHGVCDDCMHNTAGHRCEQCKEGFVRDTSKPLAATDGCIEPHQLVSLWCARNGSCYPGPRQGTGNILTMCSGNVTASSNSTCGLKDTGPFNERFCEGHNPLGIIRQSDICNLTCRSDNETLHYPPEFAIDGDNSTAWQSSQAEENVFFTVHLPRRIVLTEATMMFRSLLPKRFSLEARTWSLGKMKWLPLKLWALRCNWPLVFGGYDMPAQSASELSGNLDPACNSDDFKTAKIDRSQVSYRPLDRVDETMLFSDQNLTDHLVIDQVRLFLSLLQTKHGSVSPPAPRYYFGLYELTIGGRCHCSGHSNSCRAIDTVSADSQCLLGCNCLHNTMGEYCEMCLPLYNNKDWRPGIGEENNACEKCECHGHAQSCHYDRTLQHGVCDNCMHNTSGHRCEQCKEGFFRDANKPLSATDGCIECECHSHAQSCRYDRTLQHGVCDNCMHNTSGHMCEQCKEGFVRDTSKPLSATDGCIECECHGRAQSCHYNHILQHGVCDNCLHNTSGHRCEQCKEGFVRDTSKPLSATDGCIECDCHDHAQSCHYNHTLQHGVCNNCTHNTSGRRCELCKEGFFRDASKLLSAPDGCIAVTTENGMVTTAKGTGTATTAQARTEPSTDTATTAQAGTESSSPASTASGETLATRVAELRKPDAKITPDKDLLPYVLITTVGGVALIIGLSMTIFSYYRRATRTLNYRPIHVEKTLVSSLRRKWQRTPDERVI